MRSAELLGKKVALLLKGQTQEGEDDWAVFLMTVVERKGRLFLEHDSGVLELGEEWAARMRPTTSETREILLDADHVLPLEVGNVTDAEASALERTGLKWPGG